MMGVVGFNSACYYRYALVDRDQLARNLARKTNRKDGKWTDDLTVDDYSEADKVIKAFLESMVYAIPSGKQKSFAAQKPPLVRTVRQTTRRCPHLPCQRFRQTRSPHEG